MNSFRARFTPQRNDVPQNQSGKLASILLPLKSDIMRGTAPLLSSDQISVANFAEAAMDDGGRWVPCPVVRVLLLRSLPSHTIPSLTLVSLPPSGNGGESSIQRTCASTQPGTLMDDPPSSSSASPSLPPPFSFVRSHSFREVISKVNTTGPTGQPGGGSGGRRRLPSPPSRGAPSSAFRIRVS